MKKTIALLVLSAIGFSSLCVPAVSASQSENNSIVLFGDSIAKGTTVSGGVEHNYGEICADYLGYNLYNFAQDGYRTGDLLNMLATDTEAISAAEDAEVIVLSIGGNNLLRHATKYILDYAASVNSTVYPLLNEGYTAADIPADPAISDLTKYLNKSELKAYFLENQTLVTTFISGLRKYLTGTTSNATGFVQTEIVPETIEIIETIKAINPDAEIILQTVYQPFQFSQDFWNENFTGDSTREAYGLILNRFRNNMETAITTYRTELMAIEGVKIADVYYEFTSVDGSLSQSQQGYTQYFTDIQAGGASIDMTKSDFHPNQKGHVAIAAAVLEQIGILHEDSGLLKRTFESLEDKASYPEIAYETYLKVAGTSPLTTTTTTTTSTTITTTTTDIPIERALGDVNFDYNITGVDAAMVLAEYAALQTNSEPSFDIGEFYAADVNADGVITAVDAAKILSYYAYASTTPEDQLISFEEFLKQ